MEAAQRFALLRPKSQALSAVEVAPTAVSNAEHEREKFSPAGAFHVIFSMPNFTYYGRLYHNPVELALDQIGSKWKMPILWRLKDRVLRYGELRRTM